MKRKLVVFSMVILLGTSAMFSSCSKDDNPVKANPTEAGYLWVHFLEDSVKISFDALSRIDAGGVEAIQLDQFIDTTLIPIYRDKNGTPYDSRFLYAYQIVGDDGYSASGTKGYSDNIWAHMLLGHIVMSTRQVVFPDDKIDLLGAYNVKEARHIYIHRKFDVEKPDTTLFVVLKSLTTTQVTNFDGQPEQGVALKDIIPLLVAEPENYGYNLRALDGFGPETNMTWSQFQTGYWLLTTEQTIFQDATLVGGRYKLKVLEKIRIIL